MQSYLTWFVLTLCCLLIKGDISSLSKLEVGFPPIADLSVKDADVNRSLRSIAKKLYQNGAARELRVKRQWEWRREESDRCERSIRQKRQFFNPYFGGGIGGFGGFGGGCCCCCCCTSYYGKK
ncbi:30S ribosomal protein S21 domain protein [Teladorsagia circumcincta]|uniref:30S ribosomal protein S21 domain protein n=1 Tax=Teladorsagia circumcincta TaxID=45464 RepID=A0A2G9UT34_TELCI|nr:30S ribosomal protein S21 domain protein [Teladorsagia circumcincta]